MAFAEEVHEAESQANARGDFLDEEENNQLPPPTQMTPPPIQGDEAQDEGQEVSAPPPPPPPAQGDENNDPGTNYPTRYWCVFPQRIDTDGPHPEIIWNPGDWELPYGSLQAEQGDQVTIKLSDSFPTPFRMFFRVVS